jgi:hypothetical protein
MKARLRRYPMNESGDCREERRKKYRDERFVLVRDGRVLFLRRRQ